MGPLDFSPMVALIFLSLLQETADAVKRALPTHKASVGLVHRGILITSFELCSGEKLPSFEIVYETYGTLNDKKDNAILICHALSGDHHAAGYHSELDLNLGGGKTALGRINQ